MDHLPLPASGIARPFEEVPCYTSEPYDGHNYGWLTYPERQEFGPRTTREWFLIFEKPKREFLGFLQRWLFFGTLETVIGAYAPLHYFTCQRGNPSRTVITTKNLDSYLRFFLSRPGFTNSFENSLLVLQRLSEASRIAQLMYGDKRFYEDDYEPMAGLNERMDLRNFMMTNNFKDPRTPEFALSISLMLETLYNVVALLPAVQAKSLRAVTGVRSLARFKLINDSILPDAPELTIVYTCLRGKGWCPSRLYNIYFTMGLAAMVYMCHLDVPQSRRPHQMIRIRSAVTLPSPSPQIEAQKQAVDLCDPDHCGVAQLDAETYDTSHTKGCKGCKEMAADPTEMLRILRSGSIPLILSTDEDHSAEGILLEESGVETENHFVAISHVWSDGLGNTKRSALPQCQIRRLSRLIRSLPGAASDTVLFWIDTICCPPKIEQTEAHDLAISMMARTYRDAKAVLVLDEWLYTTDSGAKTDSEILLRIFASNWNSRLWTFQEGAFARTLFFQFSNRAYDVRRGLEAFRRQASPTELLNLQPTIEARAQDLLGFGVEERSIPEKIQSLANALQFRSTSMASDEAICLSSLLDIDLAKVKDGSAETRMERLWKLIDRVPLNFVWRNWPRLNGEGVRWAPKSMLRSPSNMDFSMSTWSETSDSPPDLALDTVECDGSGLHVRANGFFLPTEKLPIGSFVDLATGKGKIYRMVISWDRVNGKGASMAPSSIDLTYRGRGEPRIDVWEIFQSEELAFINIMGQGDEEAMDLSECSEGILTAVVRREGGVVHVRHLCAAHWDLSIEDQCDHNFRVIDGHIGYLDTTNLRAGYSSRVLRFSRATMAELNQRWCIG